MKKEEIVIHEFRSLLISSWNWLDISAKEHNWHSDTDIYDEWIERNWEVFLQRKLLPKGSNIAPLLAKSDSKGGQYQVNIEVAGDCYVYNKVKYEKEPIHGNFKLEGFLSKYQNTFGCYPPFDFVTFFKDKKRCYKSVFEVKFVLTTA